MAARTRRGGAAWPGSPHLTGAGTHHQRPGSPLSALTAGSGTVEHRQLGDSHSYSTQREKLKGADTLLQGGSPVLAAASFIAGSGKALPLTKMASLTACALTGVSLLPPARSLHVVAAVSLVSHLKKPLVFLPFSWAFYLLL